MQNDSPEKARNCEEKWRFFTLAQGLASFYGQNLKIAMSQE